MKARSGSRAILLAMSVLLLQSSAAWSSTTSSDASSVLAELASSFSSGRVVKAVQLDGIVSRNPDSPSGDTGSITLIGRADGSSEVGFNLSDGKHTETHTRSNSSRSCNWTGPDGRVHDSTGSSCWTALVWFLPQVGLHPKKMASALGTEYKGLQSRSTGSAHVIKNQLVIGGGKTPARVTANIMQQSTTALSVDPSTMLPSSLQYTILSDSGTVSISVEVRYSKYQRLSGLMIPGRIERYLNGSLELAIDVTQATILN